MSKDTSISHRALDQLTKLQASIVTDVGKFKTDVIKDFTTLRDGVVSNLTELTQKHNDLCAQVSALQEIQQQLAGFVASEMGKTHGQIEGRFQTIGRSMEAFDVNILALAELNKEVIGQLTQINLFLERLSSYTGTPAISAEEVVKITADAEAWYKDLLKAAFGRARASFARQQQEAEEKAVAAEEAAKQVANEAAEKAGIEEELKKAASGERAIVTTTSGGGAGSEFPEGADIFGG